MKSTTRDIGMFINIDDTKLITNNKNINYKYPTGELKPVYSCRCSITARQSIRFNMEVIDNDIYEEVKDEILDEINKFKKESIMLASQYEVPII